MVRYPQDRYLPPVDEAGAEDFKTQVNNPEPDAGDDGAATGGKRPRHTSQADQLYSRVMTGNNKVRDIDLEVAREVLGRKPSKKRRAARKVRAVAKRAGAGTRKGAAKAAKKTRSAAKKTGSGAKKAAKRSGSGVKKAAARTGSGVKRAAKKVASKTRGAAKRAGAAVKRGGSSVKRGAKKVAGKGRGTRS